MSVAVGQALGLPAVARASMVPSVCRGRAPVSAPADKSLHDLLDDLDWLLPANEPAGSAGGSAGDTLIERWLDAQDAQLPPVAARSTAATARVKRFGGERS